jgi:hypothetical protein
MNTLILRITGFVDFVHSPEFQITRKHNVSETGYVTVFRLGEGDTCSVGDSFPNLEFRTMANSTNPVLLNIVHYRQNSSDSTPTNVSSIIARRRNEFQLNDQQSKKFKTLPRSKLNCISSFSSVSKQDCSQTNHYLRKLSRHCEIVTERT